MQAGSAAEERARVVSFEHRERVVTLNLDREAAGIGYDVVVVEVDDPEAVAAAIEPA